MAEPKYSYLWTVVKGEYKGEELFLPLAKGRKMEKAGYVKLKHKMELKLTDKGTALVPVKSPAKKKAKRKAPAKKKKSSWGSNKTRQASTGGRSSKKKTTTRKMPAKKKAPVKKQPKITAADVKEERPFFSEQYQLAMQRRPWELSNRQLADWWNKHMNKDPDGVWRYSRISK